MRIVLVLWLLGAGSILLTGQQAAPSGSFTEAQAETGRLAYQDTCGKCRTPTLRQRIRSSGYLLQLQ